MTYLAPYGHWPLEDAMHAQDCRLGRVDDGCAKHGSKNTAVTDGERASVHILHGQFVLASLRKR